MISNNDFASLDAFQGEAISSFKWETASSQKRAPRSDAALFRGSDG